MASFHRCSNCGCETDMSNALAAFEENPHCRQCGLSVTESDSKMQDDLVNMMTQHLQLNAPQHQQNVSMPPTPQTVPHVAPITYITQHYHHSNHQVPAESSISAVLEAAGVNASVLLPSQLMLFKNAPQDQRERLIELWKIAPPTPGNQMLANDLGNWPQTSLEQEEQAAHHRWEVMERERLRNLCAIPTQENRMNAEPYMISGYENVPNINGVTAPTEYGTAKTNNEQKPSSDPVYNSFNSREWWQTTPDEEPMEHQYGLLQHMMYAGYVQYGSQTKDDEEML